MQGDGELHDSEVRAEMTPVAETLETRNRRISATSERSSRELISRRHSGETAVASTDSAGTVMTLMSISAYP